MMNSESCVWVEKRQIFAVITLLVFLFISHANAVVTTCTTNDAIQIDVVSGSYSASYTYNPSTSVGNPFDWDEVFANPDTKYNWYLPEDEQFDIYDSTDGTTLLAHVSQLSFAVQADPVMDFGFSVDTSLLDTEFTISSPLITFGEIVNPSEVQAYSEVSATPGTSKITGNLTGDKVYSAVYNTSSVFANLVDSPIAISTGSPVADEGTGIQSIAGGVTSMQGIYSFTLTRDQVGDTWSADAVSQYSIVPEPTTMALLGLGGLLLRKRRV